MKSTTLKKNQIIFFKQTKAETNPFTHKNSKCIHNNKQLIQMWWTCKECVDSGNS